MPLTHDEIESKVVQLIAEQLGADEADVTPDALLVDTLGADSLDMVEMMIGLEEAFHLEIPDEDMENIRIVDQVVAYIEKRTT